MDKADTAHVGNGHFNSQLLKNKNRTTLPFATTNGLWWHSTEWNKSDREKQKPYDLTDMWNLKNKQIKFLGKGPYLNSYMSLLVQKKENE